MKALHELQQLFQRYLLTGAPEIQSYVSPTPTLSAEATLEIYSSAYRLRLQEALIKDYEGVHTLVGDEIFEGLTEAYLRRYPSQHFSLRYFGQHLSAFLQQEAGLEPAELLAEMALWEWTMGLTFDAPEAPVLTLEHLQAIPPEDWGSLCWGFHPSLQTLKLHWNVPALWKAIKSAQEIPSPERQESPILWSLWRKELASRFRSLEAPEAWALEHSQAQASLEALCEGLCRWWPEAEVPVKALSLVQRWIQEGWTSTLRQQQ